MLVGNGGAIGGGIGAAIISPPTPLGVGAGAGAGAGAGTGAGAVASNGPAAGNCAAGVILPFNIGGGDPDGATAGLALGELLGEVSGGVLDGDEVESAMGMGPCFGDG